MRDDVIYQNDRSIVIYRFREISFTKIYPFLLTLILILVDQKFILAHWSDFLSTATFSEMLASDRKMVLCVISNSSDW